MRLRTLMFALLLAASPACLHPPPPTLVTPAGQAAYAADQVVGKLTELANLVKADVGSAQGNINYPDAFTVIEWISGDAHATPPTTGLVQLVQTTVGQGWKPAALAGWQSRIRPLLLKYPTLAPWVSVIDALLQEVA